MGTSTNAMLVYGYHLGGDEGGWELVEADEYGGFDLDALDWYDEDEDLGGSIEKKLLAAHGFVETDWRTDGTYFDRKAAAKAAIGVEVGMHCSADFPMWVLGAKVLTAYRGDCKVVDFDALNREAAENGWDDKLRAALSVLGLTPKQERAQWLLCSYWG